MSSILKATIALIALAGQARSQPPHKGLLRCWRHQLHDDARAVHTVSGAADTAMQMPLIPGERRWLEHFGLGLLHMLKLRKVSHHRQHRLSTGIVVKVRLHLRQRLEQQGLEAGSSAAWGA